MNQKVNLKFVTTFISGAKKLIRKLTHILFLNIYVMSNSKEVNFSFEYLTKMCFLPLSNLYLPISLNSLCGVDESFL